MPRRRRADRADIVLGNRIGKRMVEARAATAVDILDRSFLLLAGRLGGLDGRRSLRLGRRRRGRAGGC